MAAESFRGFAKQIENYFPGIIQPFSLFALSFRPLMRISKPLFMIFKLEIEISVSAKQSKPFATE